MPRIESQKANKSQESPEKAICIKKKVLNHISTKFPKFFSVRELKIKYISHTKGHYGQRILNKNSERKAQGGLKRTKGSQSTKKCKMAWE